MDLVAGARCRRRARRSRLSLPQGVSAARAEAGQIAIAADDAYDLYVNSRRVASGGAQEKLVEHDVSRFLTRGANVIAIKVANRTGKTAALVARVTVKEKNGGWQSHSTDGTWKTELSPLPLWNTALYNDRAWANATAFAELNAAPPASNPASDPAAEATASVDGAPPGESVTAPTSGPAADSPARGNRFSIDNAFEVQQVLPGDATGSLIAMTFNEFGHILAAKEGGGLLADLRRQQRQDSRESPHLLRQGARTFRASWPSTATCSSPATAPTARPLSPGRQRPRRHARKRPHARPLQVRGRRARRRTAWCSVPTA